MKKLALLLIATLFFNLTQADDGKKVRVGLTGSGAFSWLKPNIDGEFGLDRKGLKLGYAAGIALDFRLFDSPNYAFSTGISLMQIGGKLNYPDISIQDSTGSWSTTATYNLRYVDIPVSIKMKTNEIGYLTYFAQVGTSIGVNIKATRSRSQENNFDTNEKYEIENENAASEIALFRVPLVVGAGVEYNLSGNTSIAIGLQFNNGFTNVYSPLTKNNPGVYDLTETKEVLYDVDGNPVLTDKKKNALTNYMALTVGLFF
jgi:hypothetical protein